MNRYNSQAFTPEECAKGLHTKLINSLMEISSEMEGGHFDILITTDGYCTIVEWVDTNPEYEEATFKFVDYDEVIMKEVTFPDRHYEYLFPDEVDEALKDWHEKHPEWVKGPFDTWTNIEENRLFAIDFRLKELVDKYQEHHETELKLEDFKPGSGISQREHLDNVVDVLIKMSDKNLIVGRDLFYLFYAHTDFKPDKHMESLLMNIDDETPLPSGKMGVLHDRINVYYTNDPCYSSSVIRMDADNNITDIVQFESPDFRITQLYKPTKSEELPDDDLPF